MKKNIWIWITIAVALVAVILVAVMGNHSLPLFGYELTAVPLLLIGQAVLSALSWLFVRWFTPQFAPESEMAFYTKGK